MRVPLYAKKPVRVAAMQVTPDSRYDVMAWINNNGGLYCCDPNGLYIQSLEGRMFCPWGSYVVMGLRHREFWVVRGDIFEETYEEVA